MSKDRITLAGICLTTAALPVFADSPTVLETTTVTASVATTVSAAIAAASGAEATADLTQSTTGATLSNSCGCAQSCDTLHVTTDGINVLLTLGDFFGHSGVRSFGGCHVFFNQVDVVVICISC